MTPNVRNNPAIRRRWFRFSLRTLLAAMVLVGVPFAWIGHKVKCAIDQREAVRAIQALGGYVSYAKPTSFVQRNTWLRDVVGDGGILDVELIIFLGPTQITDAELVHVSRLTQLKGLNLGGTQVSDESLVHLRGLLQLEWLSLDGTNVSDAGLVHLSEMKQLERLYLRDTQVSDVGLIHLSRLTQLKSLQLDGTQVSDPGLVRLHLLTKLRSLGLSGTHVTEAGVRDLRGSLPKVGTVIDVPADRNHRNSPQ